MQYNFSLPPDTLLELRHTENPPRDQLPEKVMAQDTPTSENDGGCQSRNITDLMGTYDIKQLRQVWLRNIITSHVRDGLLAAKEQGQVCRQVRVVEC